MLRKIDREYEEQWKEKQNKLNMGNSIVHLDGFIDHYKDDI